MTNGKWNNISKSVKSNTIKDVIKIRLHIWNTKWNYKRNELDTTYPLCKTEEDTTEHIIICQEGNSTYNLLDENGKDWEKIVAIYKNNKKNREKLEQQKKYRRKRYTIEGWNIMEKSNELTQAHTEKT